MRTGPIAIGAAILLLMGLEALLSRRNERALRARGAIEPRGDVHPWMAVAYPLGFVAIALEGASRGASSPVWIACGLTVLAVAKALKYWAIHALADRWSFRVLVLPGAPLVAHGPYRFMRHPNYVAVVGEFVGATLACHAWVAGPIATAVFLFLIRQRVRVEEAALSS